MRKVTVQIGGLIAAASAAAMLVSVSPAFASTSASAAAAKSTGPEVITGRITGAAAIANTPHIPLTFAGVVATTDKGFVLGSGTSNTHTLTTPAGKLTVTGVGKQNTSETVNAKTCYFTYTTEQQFNFVPGQSTGKFAGATGPGAYQITFAAYVPRITSGKDKGQCNENANPLAKGAVASFLAAGVLTVG